MIKNYQIKTYFFVFYITWRFNNYSRSFMFQEIQTWFSKNSILCDSKAHLLTDDFKKMHKVSLYLHGKGKLDFQAWISTTVSDLVNTKKRIINPIKVSLFGSFLWSNSNFIHPLKIALHIRISYNISTHCI